MLLNLDTFSVARLPRTALQMHVDYTRCFSADHVTPPSMKVVVLYNMLHSPS